MSINVSELWDYSNPELSEQHFREALVGASHDDGLILKTQIARTYTRRAKFDRARAILAEIEKVASEASPEVQSRFLLELGRAHASPTHSKDARTLENDSVAKTHYLAAFRIASKTSLDYLAIDALHMMPVVDSEPKAQLEWNEKALEYLEKSDQPDAKEWEAALRNNVGYARHLMGEYEEALRQFRLSLSAHERDRNLRSVRIARWMIAWTYRAQQRYDEAIDIQLHLEQECHKADSPDPFVYEELEHLYRAVGNTEKEFHYHKLLLDSQN